MSLELKRIIILRVIEDFLISAKCLFASKKYVSRFSVSITAYGSCGDAIAGHVLMVVSNSLTPMPKK